MVIDLTFLNTVVAVLIWSRTQFTSKDRETEKGNLNLGKWILTTLP